MPKYIIDIASQIEYLSILDENGLVDNSTGAFYFPKKCF